MAEPECQVIVKDGGGEVLLEKRVASQQLASVGQRVLNRNPGELLTFIDLIIYDKDMPGMGDDPPTGALAKVEYLNNPYGPDVRTMVMLTKAEGEEVLAAVEGG